MPRLCAVSANRCFVDMVEADAFPPTLYLPLPLHPPLPLPSPLHLPSVFVFLSTLQSSFLLIPQYITLDPRAPGALSRVVEGEKERGKRGREWVEERSSAPLRRDGRSRGDAGERDGVGRRGLEGPRHGSRDRHRDRDRDWERGEHGNRARYQDQSDRKSADLIAPREVQRW